MPIHLKKAINRLMEQLIALSASVEDSVKQAVRSLEEKNIQLAEQVIKNDEEIDKRELDIEEECLKIFALHQPVAIDLRYLVAVLKINNDLERIGDLASNISRHSIKILSNPIPIRSSHFHIQEMYNHVQPMLKKSLDAIVNLDVDTAHEILKADDEVDHMHKDIAKKVIEEIQNNSDHADILLYYLHIARHLERIADHATNIAEDVIYLIKGEIVRHSIVV